ncbi:ATP-binding protein [Candidatus Woesearchaeota archaeon]|nr:ATP-binding protein [Candidatus Woesearchaeota archaeon]
MPYDIIIGRDKADKAMFGKKGLVNIGRSFVKMGQTTSLANNILLDVARSHVILVSGKRGSGKSYSLSVIAEEISLMPEEIKGNMAVIIFDTMGIFWTMKFPNKRDEKILAEWNMKPKAIDVSIYTPIGYYDDYKNRGIPTDYAFAFKPSELNAGEWCNVFDVKMTDPVGVLIEKVISGLKESKKSYTMKDIIKKVQLDSKAQQFVKDSAENFFIAASSWGLFSDNGIEINDILKPGTVNIIDVSCYTSISGAWSIKNLVIGMLCKKIINSRISIRKYEELESIETEGKYLVEEKKSDLPLVWIVLDEAHSSLPKTGFTPATDALVQLLREGRQPGISMLLATQQPGKIHNDVLTQSDIIISHRLTAKLDITALNSMMQSYLTADLQKHMNDMPKESGSALLLDDNSERIYPMKVHPKLSWHGGETPSAVKIKKKLEFDL